jgi:hypothetical protein
LVFKDRAACCHRDCVLPCFDFSAASRSTSGLRFLFRSGFAVKRPLSLRFTASPLHLVGNSHRAGALCFFLRGGAEPTSLPPSLSTGFVDPFFRSLDSAAIATSPFRGAALLPPPRQVSTPLVDFVFRLSIRPGAPTAVAASLSRPRGAASTTAALGVNRSFEPVDSPRQRLFPAALARLPGFMTAFGTCQPQRPVPSGSDHRRPHPLQRRHQPSVLLILERTRVTSLRCHRCDTAP